jgi:adenylate kinase family enzyme
VLVAGSSGAGKTTLARALAGALDLPHTEIDALFHGPGWQPRPSFRADVEALLAAPRWVTEYQYDEVRPLLLAAADAVVWLDHPFPLVARRVVLRSLARAVDRRPLFNGNRERPTAWLRGTHPARVVLSRRFAAERARTAAELADAATRGVAVVRLRGARQVRAWLASVAGRGHAPWPRSTTQKRLPSGSARTTKSGSSG